MEIKSLGTFNQIGRPIDAIRFEVINGIKIRYQSVPADGLAMPVQSNVKVRTDPHTDYFDSLDKLVPFAIKVLDLGPNWVHDSAIGSLKLDWTYSDRAEMWFYKIAEITIARSSHMTEIEIPRMVKFGGIIIDDIPASVQDAIETIMDEAWLYCSGKKTAQLNLFDVAPKSKAVESKPLISIQMDVVNELLELGVERCQIDDYLERAGESPSTEGFQDWLREQVEQEEPIETSKSTRSKSTAKKKAA